VLGIPSVEGSPTPVLGTLLGEGDLALALKDDPGTLAEPTGQDWEPGVDIAAITRPLIPDADWQKLIFGYLRLSMIPDDETETWCLAHQANGYLIHDHETKALKNSFVNYMSLEASSLL
jgi:hypothetical protein